MTDYTQMTDSELKQAMNDLEANYIAKPESKLKVGIFGALSHGTPHYEYFRRSVMKARFGKNA